MCPCSEVETLQTWYYQISLNSSTLVILLQINPTFNNEPKTIYEGLYKIEDTSIFVWSLIPNIEQYRWYQNLIHQLLPNNKVDYLICTIRCVLNFLKF
jgi:hypothetical protein